MVWQKACLAVTSMIRKASLQPQLPQHRFMPPPMKPHDVFINHRGVDTKARAAGLVYDYLRWGGFHPFLDAESLKPGERNPEAIDKAIHRCEVGVLIFSPNYGESLYCLDELVQLMETGKPLLPIFCDIEPSELRVGERQVQRSSVEQAKKWADALEEAKGITGLRFNSHAG
ncbi:hypothetical protein MLD38_039762 [Melastoma candidum]|uniref:Uncharacterized protein n=1 Tax=Melastoma candidum TaxID=119954 RepID=A0ACB9L3J2_9MYRT|nr:hypothetical protein MLD38_039762 [Melastoma candidum]